MSAKLSVGLQQKINQPDSGSLCASCHVEFEIDQTMLDSDLDGFHQQVRHSFAACQQAVAEQLARQQAAPASPPINAHFQNGHASSQATAHSHPNGNGYQDSHANGNSNGHANGNGNPSGSGNPNGNGSRSSNERQATASQVRAIYAITSKARINLLGELNQRFGVSRPDELTLSQASQLIDAIKAQANGTGSPR